MHFSSALFSLAAFTAVRAADVWTIPVAVGPDGLLQYLPNNIVAPVGSQIEFIFNPKNHTVTQSSFANPCHPLEGGFFSGFVPTAVAPSSTTFTITVNDTKPIWFYCGQTTGNHCQKGMVGAINAPTTGNTLEAFIALAAKANTSTSPAIAGVGGILKTSNSTTQSASSVFTTAAATSYAVSTYTSAGQVVTTTLSTATVFETVFLEPTAVAAASSGSSNSGSSGSSSSTAISSPVATGAAPEKTAHLLGAAVLGLGALALL